MPYINDTYFPTNELKDAYRRCIDAVDEYDRQQNEAQEDDAFLLEMANLCM